MVFESIADLIPYGRFTKQFLLFLKVLRFFGRLKLNQSEK